MTDEKTVATERAYDGAASAFKDLTSTRSDVAARFLQRFSSRLPPGAVVADVGCGAGHDGSWLTIEGHRVVGFDRSAELLSLCQRIETVRADLRALPVPDDRLDGLWCSAALLHIDRSQVSATLHEFGRVVRHGGVVAIATSLGDDEGWELVPAPPSKIPELGGDERRWFVHHRADDLFEWIDEIGWTVEWHQVIERHRRWLQVLARVEH